jgi:predicted membrane metal-binding protein
MNRPFRSLRWALLAVLVMSAPACLAAAAAVGAGGAIAWTQRGASSSVPGSVDQVYQRAEAVFREMGITQTGQSSGDQGAERSLKGTREDMEVTVEIERESASTAQVEVYARRNTVEFDRNYARDVLTRIVNRN